MNGRLLVIDDNAEDRFAIRRMLAGAGTIELAEAETGEDGLRQLASGAFDAVLLDYRLPDMDGIEFLDRLAGFPGVDRPAVIALTGQGNESVASEMMKAGADDYLIKASISAEVLERSLTQALNKVQLERRIELRNRDLAQANSELEREIVDRLTAQRRLQEAQQSLEHLVQERTRELSRALARELEARAEAERASRAKDDFLGVVSHELRTPLNAIVGWIELLRVRRLDAAETERALETIERNARALAKLVSDLLDVSRISSHKFPVEHAPVPIGELVAAVAEDVRPLVQGKALAIDVRVEAASAVVVGDRGRLRQALENVVMNAIKFTEQGRIAIEATEEGDRVVIRVTDSGIGIEPEFLPRIFERFQQADSSSARRHGGLGLGLAITKEVVDQHDGTIVAKSAGLGHGTTVELSFRRSEHAGGTERPEPRGRFAVPLEGVKVLLIDDDADSRDLLRQVLEGCGATVETAADAVTAIVAFARFAPDVLVSDIGLPGLDGFGLLDRLQRECHGRPIPAIAVTAYAGEEDRRQALAAGFRYHLPKPLKIDELLKSIRMLVQPL